MCITFAKAYATIMGNVVELKIEAKVGRLLWLRLCKKKKDPLNNFRMIQMLCKRISSTKSAATWPVLAICYIPTTLWKYTS